MNDLQRAIGDLTAEAALAAIDAAPADQRHELLEAAKAGAVTVRTEGNVRVVFVGSVEVARVEVGITVNQPESDRVN